MKKYYLLYLLMLLPVMASAQSQRTIHVTTAGSLSTLISDQEKYTIEQLTLTGEINGSDLGFLREMAGKETRINRGSSASPYHIFGDTDGRLTHLDLTDTKIVAGGTSMSISDLDNDFDFTVTRDNELPPRIFDGCENLISISIPNSVSSIGSYAFIICLFSYFGSEVTKRHTNNPSASPRIGCRG